MNTVALTNIQCHLVKVSFNFIYFNNLLVIVDMLGLKIIHIVFLTTLVVNQLNYFLCALNILRPCSNRSPYLFTLVQKVKYRAYKNYAFKNEAILYQGSARYFIQK